MRAHTDSHQSIYYYLLLLICIPRALIQKLNMVFAMTVATWRESNELINTTIYIHLNLGRRGERIIMWNTKNTPRASHPLYNNCRRYFHRVRVVSPALSHARSTHAPRFDYVRRIKPYISNDKMHTMTANIKTTTTVVVAAAALIRHISPMCVYTTL